jgi:hypothetical protein
VACSELDTGRTAAARMILRPCSWSSLAGRCTPPRRSPAQCAATSTGETGEGRCHSARHWSTVQTMGQIHQSTVAARVRSLTEPSLC